MHWLVRGLIFSLFLYFVARSFIPWFSLLLLDFASSAAPTLTSPYLFPSNTLLSLFFFIFYSFQRQYMHPTTHGAAYISRKIEPEGFTEIWQGRIACMQQRTAKWSHRSIFYNDNVIFFLLIYLYFIRFYIVQNRDPRNSLQFFVSHF